MRAEDCELLVSVTNGRLEVWVDGQRHDEIEGVSVNVTPRGVVFRVTTKRESAPPDVERATWEEVQRGFRQQMANLGVTWPELGAMAEGLHEWPSDAHRRLWKAGRRLYDPTWEVTSG